MKTWASVLVGVLFSFCPSVPADVDLPQTPATDIPSCRAERRQLKRVLGPDAKGARLVAYRDLMLVTVDLKKCQVRELMDIVQPSGIPDESRPYWSHDGQSIVFALDGKAFLKGPGDEAPRPILKGREVFEPSFWIDPETDESCIVFKTHDRDVTWPEDSTDEPGETVLWQPFVDEFKTLESFACDGGLSPGGRYIVDAVGHAMVRDRHTGITYPLNHGAIACNASLSPDGTCRVMHLMWPHETVVIRDRFDRLIWSIDKPQQASEINHPRWSNHPDLCTVVLEVHKRRVPAVVRISTGEMAILEHLDGEWSYPQLWTPTGAQACRTPCSPISGIPLATLSCYYERVAFADSYTDILRELRRRPEQEAKVIESALLSWGQDLLDKAAGAGDPYEAETLLETVARYFEADALGETARRELEKRGEEDRRPRALLMELLSCTVGLAPCEAEPATHAPPDDSPARQRIQQLAGKITANWPLSGAAERANDILVYYGFCEDGAFEEYGRFTAVASVSEILSVPNSKRAAPYRSALMFVRYHIDTVLSGYIEDLDVVVAHWSLLDGEPTPNAGIAIGDEKVLTCEPLQNHTEVDNAYRDVSVFGDLDESVYWAVRAEKYIPQFAGTCDKPSCVNLNQTLTAKQ